VNCPERASLNGRSTVPIDIAYWAAFAAAFITARPAVSSTSRAISSHTSADRSYVVRRFRRVVLAAAARSSAARTVRMGLCHGPLYPLGTARSNATFASVPPLARTTFGRCKCHLPRIVAIAGYVAMRA
jgi:hypothetical protein